MLEQAARVQPALFLLDIMLPGDSGLEVCRRIRQNHKLEMTPVMFLTAKGEESDRVTGLELGADDYVVKPFSPRELVARIRAVLRRAQRPEKPNIIRIGELEINGEAMSISVNGNPVCTTPTEYRLLEYLAAHPGRVFTRDQLLDAVWRDSHFVTLRSIDVFVRRLREKIEPDPEHPAYLKTVRGVGYRFDRGNNDPVAIVSHPSNVLLIPPKWDSAISLAVLAFTNPSREQLRRVICATTRPIKAVKSEQ
jgi:DNA-binding response OmpR family regulator